MEQLSSKLHSQLTLHPLTDTQQKLRRVGDTCFLAKEYLTAYNVYTQALQLQPESRDVDLLKKRAFSLYNLGAYQKGVDDCDEILGRALEPSPITESVVILKTKCLWGLQRYEEALAFLQGLDKKNEEWITRTKTAVTNSQGIFDIEALFKLSNKMASNSQNQQGFGEYRSGSFVVKEVPGKGRGLVAIKRIAAGELLIVSKAWEIVFAGDKGIKKDQDWDGYRTLLAEKIYQKLFILGEEESREFCGLSVDARSKREGSWLAGQTSLIRDQNVKVATEVKEEILGEIEYRILNNGFSRGHKFWGVWLLPALINHSCVDCNVFRNTFGDLMVVRAVKDIAIGDELTIAYVPPTHPDRIEILSQHKIPCDCRLCRGKKADLQNPATAKKVDTLLASITVSPPPTPKGKLELVRKLASLKPLPKQANLHLVDSRVNSLVAQLFAGEEWKEAAEIFSLQRQMCKSFGMMRELVEIDLHLFKANLDLGDLDEAQGWMEELKKDLILAYGAVSTVPLKKHPVVKDLEDCGISFLTLINNPDMVQMLVAR